MVANVAGLDDNSRRALSALSNANDGTVVDLWADPTTHRLLVDNANSSAGIVVGTTTVTGGTTTRVLFDNAGVVGEYTISGTGNVAMTTSPVFTTPNIGTATGSITGNAATVTTNANLTGAVTSSGNATSLGSFTSAQLLAALTDETGTGAAVFANTPTLVTPVLGVATATSINGNTLTTGTYTLTGTAGKTLNFTNSLTLSGTDSTTMTFPSTSATIARTDAANTFTGTQTIGALVATTVNGNTISAGSSTFTGSAAQTYTFPTTTATLARTDAAQTFTGTQTFSQVITTANTVTVTTNAGTVPVTSKINNFTNSSASAMTITLATASAVDGQSCIVRIFDASAVTKGITWVNTENSAGQSVPSTSAGSTTIPLTVGFIYNAGTSKWTCLASA